MSEWQDAKSLVYDHIEHTCLQATMKSISSLDNYSLEASKSSVLKVLIEA